MRPHHAAEVTVGDPRSMDIRFPGGLRVDALHEGFWIRTDQPVAQGGEGSAPSPFDLFLASIGTCAGFYALGFCNQRNLDTKGLELSVVAERDPAAKRVARVRIEMTLPPAFPEKYRDAIIRAVDLCAVKRHLVDPPRIDVTVLAPGEAAASNADWVSPLEQSATHPS